MFIWIGTTQLLERLESLLLMEWPSYWFDTHGLTTAFSSLLLFKSTQGLLSQFYCIRCRLMETGDLLCLYMSEVLTVLLCKSFWHFHLDKTSLLRVWQIGCKLWGRGRGGETNERALQISTSNPQWNSSHCACLVPLLQCSLPLSSLPIHQHYYINLTHIHTFTHIVTLVKMKVVERLQFQ